MKIDTSEIMADFRKRQLQRVKEFKECMRGNLPLAIYKSGLDYYSCKPFTKTDVWEHPNGKKVLENQMINDNDLAIDTTGITAKKLNEIRKQKRALHLKEQRIIKKAFETFKVMKVPELK